MIPQLKIYSLRRIICHHISLHFQDVDHKIKGYCYFLSTEDQTIVMMSFSHLKLWFCYFWSFFSQFITEQIQQTVSVWLFELVEEHPDFCSLFTNGDHFEVLIPVKLFNHIKSPFRLIFGALEKSDSICYFIVPNRYLNHLKSIIIHIFLHMLPQNIKKNFFPGAWHHQQNIRKIIGHRLFYSFDQMRFQLIQLNHFDRQTRI